MAAKAFSPEEMSLSLKLVDEKIKKMAPNNIDGAKRFLKARGKRLRPRLVFTIAAVLKEVSEPTINAATAVELVHIASLIHDDITDNGTQRWSVPTINSKEGNDSAILSGDYLFAKGCTLAAMVSAEAAEVMSETIAKLCEGQARELSDLFNLNRKVRSLNQAVTGKTASLFIAACKLGGIVAGLNSKQIEHLSNFGQNFGLAFQYLDDVRNFTQMPAASGKSAQNDVVLGNYTLPILLSLTSKNKDVLKKLLKNPASNLRHIYKILDKDDSINKTIAKAQRYKDEALKSLSKIKNPELIRQLTNFTNEVWLKLT